MSSTRQLSLAVIGPGPEWESVYLPALKQLGSRVRVSAISGTTAKPVTAAAAACQSQTSGSIRALLRERSDGVLLIDPGWWGWFPARLAVEAGVSVLLTGPHLPIGDEARELLKRAESQSVLVMPELRLRYTPATLRLRELVATDLGSICQVDVCTVSRGVPGTMRVLRELLDWCRSIVGSAPATIGCQRLEASGRGASHLITMTLPTREQQPEPLQVRLQLSLECDENTANSGRVSAAADEWPIEFSVRCKYGEARLEDAVHLRWRAGGQERVESLSTERTAAGVALDHFARRLAGGLIPVPGLADLVDAERLAQLVHVSLERGEAVSAGWKRSPLDLG